jgi:drug/metabolite transporter (DMT)-like permease
VVLLGEYVGLTRWVGTLIGLAGIWMVLRPDASVLSWKGLLPVGMAFCYSLYRIQTRMLRKERSLTNLFYTAIVVFIPWSLALPLFWEPLSGRSVLTMMLIGLLGFGTLLFLDKAYETAPAAVMAPFSYSQTIFVLILSIIFIGGTLTRSEIVGCAIVIGVGIFLVFYEIRDSHLKVSSATLPTES